MHLARSGSSYYNRWRKGALMAGGGSVRGYRALLALYPVTLPPHVWSNSGCATNLGTYACPDWLRYQRLQDIPMDVWEERCWPCILWHMEAQHWTDGSNLDITCVLQVAVNGLYYFNLNVGNAMANTAYYIDDVTLSSESNSNFTNWMATAQVSKRAEAGSMCMLTFVLQCMQGGQAALLSDHITEIGRQR